MVVLEVVMVVVGSIHARIAIHRRLLHGGVYRGARPPGLDVCLHDGEACIAAAEAVGAREKPVSAESDKDARHGSVLCVDIRVVVDGALAEPVVVLGRPLERVREHVVEDVNRAVEGLGDVEEIVERRARKVLERRVAAAVRLVLRRVLDLHAVFENVVAIDGEAALGLDREPEVHLRPRATHLAHDLDVVRRVLGDRILSTRQGCSNGVSSRGSIASQPLRSASSGFEPGARGIQS